MLASGSDDRTVKLWDVANGKLLRTLAGHENVVLSVTFDQSGYMLASGSSDKTVMLWHVDSGNAWVHRDPIDPGVTAIFDPFGNAVHTALAFPMLGEDVLVTGAGPIGIMAAMVTKHAGARHVVITDRSDERLALASKLGVTRAVNIDRENVGDAQRELGMREGFDVGLEMSGSSAALRDMITQMTHGGRIAMLGLPSSEISVDFAAVVLKMLTIKGIYGREMYETWYEMSVLLESGLDISGVITDRFHYTDYEKAFAAARSGHGGKVIMTWEG